MTGEESDTAAPATLLWAVRLLLLQAVGMAALAGYLIVRLVTASGVHVGIAVSLIVFAALVAVALAAVARSLARRSHAARGPAIVVQLFLIASGGFVLQTGSAWLGVLLVAYGVTVALLILLPPTTRALNIN